MLRFFSSFAILLLAAASPVRASDQVLETRTSDCPQSLECFDLKAPLDYTKPEGKKISVAFARHRAIGQSQGVLLLAFGGPGDSGISGLRDWLPKMDKRLLENFDLVTFDLRGAHRSGKLDCEAAYGDYMFVPTRADTASDRDYLIESAQYFAEACVAEMGLPLSDLAFYGTREAIQDIDLFREQMGYTDWIIHSMSYGTQFAQQYATRFPKRVKRLVLDGAVDLRVKLLPYELDLSDAQNKVLADTFTACEKDASCAALFPTPSPLNIGRIFDTVKSSLKAADAVVVDRGRTTYFSLYDFEFTAAGQIGKAEGRLDFMRALAATQKEKPDFGLLLKLANGEKLTAAPEKKDKTFSGMSSGIFYSFICNDYGMSEANPEARALAFIQNAAAHEKAGVRVRTALYSELPCSFWPSLPKNTETNLVTMSAEIPVLVVNATGDANVPSKHGFALAASWPEAGLIDVRGGKHIMYGYGMACIDEPVSTFLQSGRLPTDRYRLCEVPLIAPLTISSP